MLLNILQDNVSSVWYYVCVGIISALLGIAFFFGLCNIFDVAPSRQVKNLRRLNTNTISTPSTFDKLLKWTAARIRPLVKMDEVKAVQIATELETLDIKQEPQDYLAESFARGLLVALLGIPCAFISIWFLVILLILGVIVGFYQYGKLDSVIAKRRILVERELPRFVSVVEQTFKNNRDVIAIIDNYTLGDSTPLIEELKIASADMKTGDYELALSRLANRVNSGYLTETVRGLISTVNGEDTSIYFASLNKKLWENERLLIKKDALKIPKRVNRLSVCMLSSMAIIYVVLFGTVLTEGLGDVFMYM